MFRLLPLLLSACGFFSTPQPVKNPYDECDEIKIGPVIRCVGVESSDSFSCTHEVDCIRKLQWICNGQGDCYDPSI